MVQLEPENRGRVPENKICRVAKTLRRGYGIEALCQIIRALRRGYDIGFVPENRLDFVIKHLPESTVNKIHTNFRW